MTVSWVFVFQRPDPINVFERAQQRVAAETDRRPDIVCRCNYERKMFSGPNTEAKDNLTQPGSWGPLLWSDQLGLDVMFDRDREYFSWPGSTAFSSASLSEMIGSPSTTGEFWPFVVSVFLPREQDRVHISPLERNSADESIHKFGFEVPLESSRYTIVMGGREHKTAYSGNFLLDSNALLARLEINLTNPPAETGVAAGRIETWFDHLSISGLPATIPTKSEFRLLSTSGDIAVITTKYSDCRRYGSSSEFSVGSPTLITSVQPHAVALGVLPTGTIIRSKLMTPLDVEHLSVGQTVDFRISSVEDRHSPSRPMASGAILRGRVVFCRRYFVPSERIGIGIDVTSISTSSSGEQQVKVKRIASSGIVGERTIQAHTPGMQPSCSAIIERFGTTKLKLSTGEAWNWVIQ